MSDYLRRGSAMLAMRLAVHGLARVLGGWRSRHPDADPRSLVSSRTVLAFARRGVLTIDAAGRYARLNRERIDP